MKNRDEDVLFYESQRITQWYIYLPLIIIEVALIVKNIEKPKINYMDILIPTAIILGIALLFLSYKMTTTITKNYIIVKMSWFGIKKFSLETIKYFILGKYSFVGYGFRVTKFGRAYNVNGNQGMLFDYDNKKVLIGTQKEEELLLVVRNLALKEQIVELSASTTIQGYLKENK